MELVEDCNDKIKNKVFLEKDPIKKDKLKLNLNLNSKNLNPNLLNYQILKLMKVIYISRVDVHTQIMLMEISKY